VNPKAHWEHIWTTHRPDEVSWFESEAGLSLELIEQIAPDRESAIIDIGGGAATLVDGLLDAGYCRTTVLDLSAAALERTQHRLAERARMVAWREADLLSAELPADAFDVWHDRAVFHFLTDAADRARYVSQAKHSLRRGGYALVATFAEDGPARCSGLEVARYSANALHGEFGRDFRVVASQRQMHHTPWGTEQAFTYCLCRYEPHAFTRHAA